MARALLADVQPMASDSFVELCAGNGELTRLLMGQVAEIHAIEIDARMAPFLEEIAASAPAPAPTKLRISIADARDCDLAQGARPARLIGNLAYNLTAPLMQLCLDGAAHIVDAHFMLQREVAERLRASPGSRAYGRLAVAMQSRFEVSMLRRVPRQCFSPRPKVESAFVRLRPLARPLIAPARQGAFGAFARRAFSMRRKSLANNLRGACDPARLASLPLAPGARAEQLSPSELAAAFEALHPERP